ncbi:cytochrome P450 4c3-like [Toxorhynchites rutilus septentrionalis]|uniref:cytochrome P450 4c3-like n=1 Tax=Toxorhynchites rutilus septentrionalis TaxID=329112 RepID=UPI0024796392|nr:cytochrome P450 4c3-like [Toxorhynchites rutilus septentrionalis]
MIVTVVIIFCGIFILKCYQRRKRFLRALHSIPGPKGLPLLGNAAEGILCDPAEFHDKLEQWVKQFGTRIKIDLFTKFWILHSSPEDIEKVATDSRFNRKSEDYNQLQEWLGNGILLDHGPSWFVNRKALTDAFHFKVLENFIPTSQQQSEILVGKLLASNGQAVDIFPIMKLFTLDVILETAIGVTCDAQLNDSDYVKAVAGLSHITYWRMFNVMGYSEATFRFTKYYRPYREMLKINNDFTMDVIKRRRDEFYKEAREEGGKKRCALLDKLLQMEIEGRKLTDEEIRNQVNNFMFAGHDTTSSALTFIVFLVAKHPEVQEKLYEEMNRVLADGMIPTLNPRILSDFKYMDLVIKESLRMYPPVPYFSRTIDSETEVSGVTYPPGTTVSLGVYFMHRNPDYFPEPLCFKPERFSFDADQEKRNPYVYIPFSAGSRNCIGQKFAINEIKVALIYIVLRCRFRLDDPTYDPKLKAELVLKPVGGIPVRFTPRNI